MSSFAHHHTSVNLVSGSHPHYADASSAQAPRRHKFVAELSQCLFDFVIQLLPSTEELAVKENVRKLLERLIRTIEPQSRLLSFGSTANGFSLRNSDMDLVCLIDSDNRPSASDLVTMVGDLLERETKFHVKPLPHARIPIVKLSLDPSPGLPLGIACDIGFENRLALENTRLLLCYSMVDPTRVRTLVLFLKVWSKRRKINSPYEGTLSSYGYVLLVIYFLVHVKNPPVLPNLQQIPPLHPISPEEHHMGDRNIWFFDDIDLLRQRWQSENTESVGELLIDFFRFYAKDFAYNSGVASIRAGLLKKEAKGWQHDSDPRFKGGGERNRLCIEDPFETDYNVARCVTRDGLYIIRGEFMRASRILHFKQEVGYNVLAHLCEERDDSLSKPSGPYNTTFVPPRLSFPPQTPYSVGSNGFRPNGAPLRDRLSPPRKPLGVNAPPTIPSCSQNPPEHMAPKRTKFTSPPPAEAPDYDVASFESRLNQGLSLATAPTEAREREKAYMSSSSNSEILSDDGDARSDIAQEDDANSVQSFVGEASSVRSQPEDTTAAYASSYVPHRLSAEQLALTYQQASFRNQEDVTPTPFAHGQFARGRRAVRGMNEMGQGLPPVSYRIHPSEFRRFTFPGKPDGLRRSNSGPARQHHSPRTHLAMASGAQQMPFKVPLPPSPAHPSLSSSPTVYYETNVHGAGSTSFSPITTSFPINPLTLYQQQQYYLAHAHAQAQMQALSQSHQTSEDVSQRDLSATQDQLSSRAVHSHTHSTATIVGPPTPAALSFAQSQINNSPNNNSQDSSPSHSPAPQQTSFTRLSSTAPLRPSDASPSPTQSSMPLSFHHSSSSSRPSHHVSGSRRSSGQFSPHLSSHLPHFTRRQLQTSSRAQSIMQAQMHSQMRMGMPSDAQQQASLDLASPMDSPLSSASSQGGSVSGSVGSPGSVSPVSSTSPRRADLKSPRAPSLEPRSRKHGDVSDHRDQRPEQKLSQRTHERKRETFPYRSGHPGPRQALFTPPQRVTIPMRGESRAERSPGESFNVASNEPSVSASEVPPSRSPIVQPQRMHIPEIVGSHQFGSSPLGRVAHTCERLDASSSKFGDTSEHNNPRELNPTDAAMLTRHSGESQNKISNGTADASELDHICHSVSHVQL